MITKFLIWLGFMKEIPMETEEEFMERLMKSIEDKQGDTKTPKQLCKQEVFVDLEENKEQEDLFIKKMEAKQKIGKGNILDMIEGYDRVVGRKLLREKEKNNPIPINDPRTHFRGNIERAERMTKEEVDLERGRRFIANIDEVLNHK